MNILPRIATAWKTKSLSEASILIMGQAPKGDTYNENGVGVPLIAGAADLGSIFPKPKKWTTSPTKVGKKGDIIICVRATIGDLNWADSEYCYGRGVSGIRANSKFDPEFIWYWLAACKDHLMSLGRGATFKQISKKNLAELPIPDLELAEQRRIVARIKGCMRRAEEIEQLEGQLIDETAQLPLSFRFDLWNELSKKCKMVELGEIALSTKNGLYKPNKFHGSGTMLLRMFNINGSEFKLDRIERVELDLKEAEDFAVRNGDIIISRVNSRELVGKSALVEGLNEQAVHEAMLIRMRVNSKKVNKKFLVWLMNSPQFLFDLRGRAKHAIGQSSINQKDLLSSKLPLPSLKEQDEIVAARSSLLPISVQLDEEIKERETDFKDLRISILRKAFAGEL